LVWSAPLGQDARYFSWIVLLLMREPVLPILSWDPAVPSFSLFPTFPAVAHGKGGSRKGHDVQFVSLFCTHACHHPRPASSSETGTAGGLSLLCATVLLASWMVWILTFLYSSWQPIPRECCRVPKDFSWSITS
jgi:hypothetical protein